MTMTRQELTNRSEWSPSVKTVANKDPERQQIADDIAAFLANGGNIRHIPEGVGVGVMSISDGAEHRRNTGFMPEGFNVTREANARGGKR